MGYLHPIHTSRGVSVLGLPTPVTDTLITWIEPSKQGGSNGVGVELLTNFVVGGNKWAALTEGQQATYETDQINGLAALTFDGDNAYRMPLDTYGDLTSFTVTMLVRLDAYDGATYNTRTLFSWADAAGTSGEAGGGVVVINHDEAGIQVYSPSGTNDLDITEAIDDEEWHIVTVEASTTGGTLYFDRASAGTDTAAITIAFDRGFLGAYADVADPALGGHFKLAAFLLYSSNAAANRAAAEAYIAHRYEV